ncbi:dihydroorotate dehydrogenase [Candidatus Aerophobetes bacterium]|nr:dihydroorotate dehydrogenase [Candidatus Aerophobetes bacterium]
MKEKERESGIDLTTRIGRLTLKNPVIVASGTFGYGEEYKDYVDLKRLGAVVTKTVTLNPRTGNPPPRLFETAAGLLNSIGLENPGVRVFIEEKLPFLRKIGVDLIVSIAGERQEEYLEIAQMLGRMEGIKAIEVNVSCPNVESGPLQIGKDPELVFLLVEKLKKVTSLPLLVKLSPQIGRIIELAQAVREGGADGLSLINTFPAMAIDVENMRPRLGGVTGGLSGPAIKPVALRIVWEVFRNVDIPIIGMGGIMSAEDAIEFFLVGARAVAIGTANFIDPGISLRIIEDLKKYLSERKIKSFSEIVGGIKV